jgi:thiol-disulfide isomerase/thioredoxin
VMSAAGDVAGAYGNLTARVAASPEDSTRALLQQYAEKLGKTPAQMEDEVWAKRNASAKPAHKFDLAMYTEKKNLSLDDLHGKIVLLTFWFPGCGPCRGEFPHFENVMEKFHGKAVTYVGINVFQGQDPYVLPFMDGTKYTFIPLHGDDKVITKAYNVRGEPSNFLIDQNGRIVYADFRASDPDSELLLQRMIESLLSHPGSTS